MNFWVILLIWMGQVILTVLPDDNMIDSHAKLRESRFRTTANTLKDCQAPDVGCDKGEQFAALY